MATTASSYVTVAVFALEMVIGAWEKSASNESA